jgi:hypothetical protein
MAGAIFWHQGKNEGLGVARSQRGLHHGQDLPSCSRRRGRRAGGCPEPAAWALMIIGFGLVGSMSRCRTCVLA